MFCFQGLLANDVGHPQIRVCSDVGAVDGLRSMSNDVNSHFELTTGDTVTALYEVVSTKIPLPTHNYSVHIASSYLLANDAQFGRLQTLMQGYAEDNKEDGH